MNLTLEQLFDRTENLENSKEYNYIEQEAINGKASIISGNETLKHYPLKFKLHHSFCNPQLIIDEIEEKAENREIINYFQHGNYIGDYVINNYNVNVMQKINDVVIYAEVEIELLENPDSITEFEQQTKIIPDVELPIVSENSNKMKNFLDKAKAMIRTTVFDVVLSSLQNGNISYLSDAGKQIFNRLEGQIISEIKDSGLSKASEIVQQYTQNINTSGILAEAEQIILKNELEKIPKKLTEAVIRKSF